MPSTKERVVASCSFCLKPNDQVEKLVAGPGVYICDQCVDLCNQIIDSAPTRKPPRLAPWEQDVSLDDALASLPRMAAAGAQVERNLAQWVHKARAARGDLGRHRGVVGDDAPVGMGAILGRVVAALRPERRESRWEGRSGPLSSVRFQGIAAGHSTCTRRSGNGHRCRRATRSVEHRTALSGHSPISAPPGTRRTGRIGHAGVGFCSGHHFHQGIHRQSVPAAAVPRGGPWANVTSGSSAASTVQLSCFAQRGSQAPSGCR